MPERANNSCQHLEIERLGTNNGMAFERCLQCRSVIVSQGGASIVLPPPPDADRNAHRRRRLFRMGLVHDRM